VSTRTVNTTLFALVVAQWASGVGAFLVGVPSGRWVVWLHAAGGGAIIVLLAWKGRVIARSIYRHGLGWWAAPSLALLTLLTVALASGIAWSTVGLPHVGGTSGLTVHVLISLVMLPLFAPHVWKSRPHPRPRDYLARRRLLGRAALAAAGIAAWQATEQASDAAGLSGADRRFTGSREVPGAGADFPNTAWLLDNPEPIDVTSWRLHIDGAVIRPRSLRISDLAPTVSYAATLDCTGGWYARRDWHGVVAGTVLDQAEVSPGARSVVVTSLTGYSRRFSLATMRTALLATRVGDDSLGHGHGAPLRLVVPGRRGYDWVKWVTRLEVSRVPAWWNWPLPPR
jgi:DMSO/TMAO reductase YedYZ molybdopterin-dependent catalytic subunit